MGSSLQSSLKPYEQGIHPDLINRLFLMCTSHLLYTRFKTFKAYILTSIMCEKYKWSCWGYWENIKKLRSYGTNKCFCLDMHLSFCNLGWKQINFLITQSSCTNYTLHIILYFLSQSQDSRWPIAISSPLCFHVLITSSRYLTWKNAF